MKNFRQIVLLTFGLLLPFSVFGFNPSSSQAAGNGDTVQGVIDINALEQTGKVTDRVITYDEMIDSISASKHISKSEAKRLHPDLTKSSTPTLNRSLDENSLSTMTTAAVTSTTLHEIKVRQTVTNLYHPALQLFVWTYASGSFHQYNTIEDVDLDRKDISTSLVKQYSGKLRAEILSGGSQIWWYINGDFYDKGTTTVSGTATVTGLVWSGSGTISYASNYYAYWNKSGYIY
jgi:hypothetical protein